MSVFTDECPTMVSRVVHSAEHHLGWFWTCQPGKFSWHYPSDEVCYVVSGSACIANLANPEDVRDLEPGSTAHFKAGEVWVWLVESPLTKYAVTVFNVPAPLRWLRTIKRRLSR